MQTESKAEEILSTATKDLSRAGFLKYLGVISEAVANVNAVVLSCWREYGDRWTLNG